jgi:endonuclease VIII
MRNACVRVGGPDRAVRHDAGVAEGDTILRLARRFERALVGETIAATAPSPRGKAAGIERLDGRRLEGVEARGKHLLLDFGEVSLHSHLGMSGGWHFYRFGSHRRRSRSSAWAVLSGGGWEAVQFGGPTLEVMTTSRLRRDPQIARLGPDILVEVFDEEGVATALRAEPARTLGDALLDQHLVAGIGNIFKSEACFAARIDPWRKVGDLSDEELRGVLAAARALMLEAVKSGRHPHNVYRRRGSCLRCRGRISSRGQGDANRTTYWCPRCQV